MFLHSGASRYSASLPWAQGRSLSRQNTGLIQGYVIEGHVPATDIRRLTKGKPDSIGVSVPGMPIGTPGMDGPDYWNQRDPYPVLLIQKNGSSRVFNSYSAG
ncbi:MAG: metal-binding protein [Betaproteobacteria bacterium]|nr:metal-binding protein [Betaproteobacteria bacterium]